MKRIFSAIAAITVFGFLLAAHDREDRKYGFQEKEDLQKTLRFADPSKPGEIIVDNVFGPIKVEGYNGRDVQLSGRKTILAKSEDRMQRAKEEVRLDITEKGNTVDIYVDGPFRCRDRHGVNFRRHPGYEVRYDFTLRVPFDTAVELHTISEGDIEVRNVEGVFEVHNVNGRVRLTDVGGSGEAETVNGEVTVLFKRHPGAACSFKTINGDLEVGFPGDPSADFRLKTFNGDIYTDFSVTSLPARPATREEGKGKFVYKSDRFFGVRSGKGGPEIRLDTFNGDIMIRKRTA